MSGEVGGCIDGNNGNKCLIFPSTDKNKKVLEKGFGMKINIISKQ